MKRLQTNPSQLPLNEHPSPIRMYQLQDYYDNFGTTDNSNVSNALLAAVFSYSRYAHEIAKVGEDYSQRFALWFNDLSFEGGDYFQTRQVTIVNEDLEIYKRLHVLALRWNSRTKLADSKNNLNLANYLCLTYKTNPLPGKNNTAFHLLNMMYTRMYPVTPGTMAQNQGYATQPNAVFVSRLGQSSELLRIDTQSETRGIPASLRDQILRLDFYKSFTAWGFGIDGLKYYPDTENAFLPTFATGIFNIASQVSPTSIRIPLIDLGNIVPQEQGRLRL